MSEVASWYNQLTEAEKENCSIMVRMNREISRQDTEAHLEFIGNVLDGCWNDMIDVFANEMTDEEALKFLDSIRKKEPINEESASK